MPGMLVLRNDGFKTSANPIVTVTGLGSLLMAPFGSHAFNIAANISLLGIGGAFWGLVIGLVAHAVLNGRLPQRAPRQVMAPAPANKGVS
jgi:predicted benzoate:H+ symporter BenE